MTILIYRRNMSKYNYYFKISDIKIHVKIPFEITIKNESENFIFIEEKEDILVNFIQIDEPIYIDGILIYEKVINIYKTEKGFIHEFYPAPGIEPYAWLVPVNKYHYEVLYLSGKESYFEYSRNILEAINIEQVLNKYDAFVLHSSFINWKNKGIIFSAPSGTGKSTQADLWEKYEQAEIINGDRAAIRNIDGNWYAYGLPIAGSSNIFKNKRAELSHIIILKQGKQNKLKKLSPREAFIKIYSETTIHTWDSEFQENIINMITDLVQEIPVYLYECLPDKSAVDFLKSTIEGDEK